MTIKNKTEEPAKEKTEPVVAQNEDLVRNLIYHSKIVHEDASNHFIYSNILNLQSEEDKRLQEELNMLVEKLKVNILNEVFTKTLLWILNLFIYLIFCRDLK